MNEKRITTLREDKAFREQVRDDLLRDFESLNPWEFTRRREIAKRLDAISVEIEDLGMEIQRESSQVRLFR